METTGIEGRISYCGVTIDYNAADDEDDGFYWTISGATFGQPMSCLETADFMRDHHDSINDAVRQQFLADVQQAKDDAAIDRWETNKLHHKAG